MQLTQTQISEKLMEAKNYANSLNLYIGWLAANNKMLGLVPDAQLEVVQYEIQALKNKITIEVEKILSPVVVPNMVLPSSSETVIEDEESDHES